MNENCDALLNFPIKVTWHVANEVATRIPQYGFMHIFHENNPLVKSIARCHYVNNDNKKSQLAFIKFNNTFFHMESLYF